MDNQVVAFRFDRQKNTLRVLDQLLLPLSIKYIDVTGSSEGYSVIKNMNVRGAPCIAAVGCLSLIVEMNKSCYSDCEQLMEWLEKVSEYLISSRPTAVNLRNALGQLHKKALEFKCGVSTSQQLAEKLTNFCWQAIDAGKSLNRQLGDKGAKEILKARPEDEKLRILTHCNTGALATVGYGTALGVIRSLRNMDQLGHAYCTETRPYNQGSRLTAWELVQENIPATLIADSMVGYLMKSTRIDAVVVGADCVASNGDTANKIGTLQIALLAKHFNVPFYVAAPTQSIDLGRENLDSLKIEERPANELKQVGDIVLAPAEIGVWNPCFDVTSADLITGIITEFGVCSPSELRRFVRLCLDENVGNDKQALF